MDDFAAVLRRFRTSAGLSQSALAHRAQVSLQAVGALESGRRRAPYRHTVDRLATALELDESAREDLVAAAERGREAAQDWSAGAGRAAADRGQRNNLPRQLTSFVGREEVVAEVEALVLDASLVTIVGTGGVGKTRVAVHVGRAIVDRFADGAWFIELAPIGDASLVTGALAAALHIEESPARPLLDSIVGTLKKKNLLLIVDNCEHLLGEVRTTVGAILRGCPGVTILATTREALRVSGERVYRIPSLAVPHARHPSPAHAIEYGAVALFADRARAIDPQFAVMDDNAAAVVDICRRLDGIPLAIELAAARIKALAPRQLARELDERFSILTGGDDTALPRQRTMRALIDWSYELLTPVERALFARLSVFFGGFTLAAAGSVCAIGGNREKEVLEPLLSLVDKSLVQAEVLDGDSRYRLLESTREYAAERLAERGESDAVARRHALNYLEVAQRLEEAWYTAAETAWIAEAERELDNWRAALEWSLGAGGDVAVAQRLVGALSRVWYSLAPGEGRRWVRAALATVDGTAPLEVRMQLAVAEAELDGAFGQYKTALPLAENALALAREHGDPLAGARAQQSAGGMLAALGRGAEGEELLNEALATARILGNKRLEAMLLGELGTARLRRGDLSAARNFYADALANYPIVVQRQAASLAARLAEIEFAAGDGEAALSRAAEALASHSALGDDRSVAGDLCNMGAYLIALDRFDEAWERCTQALAVSRELEAHVITLFTVQHLGAIAALAQKSDAESSTRDLTRAARLTGFVDARVDALGLVRDYTEQQEYARLSAALERGLPAVGRSSAEAEGRRWTEDVAVAEASE